MRSLRNMQTVTADIPVSSRSDQRKGDAAMEVVIELV